MLDVKEVEEDPLLLLNAAEAQRRELFESLLEEGADVDLAMQIVAALRRVFEELDAQRFNYEAFCEAARSFSLLWYEILPRIPQTLNAAFVNPRGGSDDEDFWTVVEAGEIPGDYRLRWARGGLPLPEAHLPRFYVPRIWERLKDVWLALEQLLERWEEPRGYLVCPQCGRISRRSRMDQVYCSIPCRQRAAYRRDTGR